MKSFSAMIRLILLLFAVPFTVSANPQQVKSSSASWSASWDDNRSFIENRGQFYLRDKEINPAPVVYGMDASFSRIFFHSNGVTFNFTQKLRPVKDENHQGEEKFKSAEDWREEEAEEHRAVVRSFETGYIFDGANPNTVIMAEEQTADYHNYSIRAAGKERTESMIKAYRKITYKNIYNNIDIVFTIHPENGVKYAIVVRPGGNISHVKMKYSGRPSLDQDGNIRIGTMFGDIIDHAPTTFYQSDPESEITSWFLCNKNIVTFGLGEYDPAKTIIVDPWSDTPVLTNSNKIWETETSQAGDVFIYGGDSFIKLRKYNSTGALQWTYTSPWDSANYWIGGFITHPNGESYMTSGSNGEIRKITVGGTVAWTNNPNSLTSYEYWSLSFNCDLTKLVVGGSRATFSIPSPIIRGVVININLTTGAQAGVTVVGYGNTLSIPPSIQEVSSICHAPNGNFYFLTLDTLGSINNALSTINYKVPSSYSFDYYIPGYGFGTKQPISAIRADANALYTINGATLHKRNLATGAIIATAAIPGGSYTPSFLGRNVNGNGGIDIDANGNVYVGSTTGVSKFDSNLNLLSSAATTFAVYDVDVNANGEVVACGWSGGTGKVESINMNAGAQMTYVCSSSSPMSATSAQTNVTCFNLCNGTATANVSGGTGPYSYAWAPSGGNAATATGLCAGTYTCTITDATPQTTSVTVSITQPAALAATPSQTNILCNGNTTGIASVAVSGGTGAYSYTWSPSGGTAPTASNLGAGTYSVTVTDANGCTLMQSFTLTAAPSINATTSSTPATCGNTNGSASVSASGGTGTLTYLWSPSGGNASTASNIGAGTYTCTITDANNCTATAVVAVSNTGGPATSVQSQTDVLCFGDATGNATVNATGNGPFTYSWAPSGGNAASATGLTAGTYSVSVTDAANCTSIQTITITEPPVISNTITAVDATCGNNNGSAAVTVTGGTGSFTYLWSNLQTSSSISGLAGGTYSVTITDGNGCTSTASAIVNVTGAPSVTLSSSVNADCFNAATGSATVSASGGSSPYTYVWSPSGGNNATANNLMAGTYTVVVTGSDGCSQTATVTITSPSQITSAATTTPDDCGSGNGTAQISVTGGTPGYTYSWTNGDTTSISTGLAAGTYTCLITDANGCTHTAATTVAVSGSAVANAGADVTIIAGQSTLLVGTGGGTYLWSPSSSLSCSNCSSPIATPTVTTTYVLTVTDTSGCSDTDTITVYVDIECGEIFLPKAFSPNGDGQNDVYYVRGNCFAMLQFEIYNRWGELVFATNDVAKGWDGTWRGKACEAAVFTYFLRGTLLDGTEIERQGNISLVK